MTEKKSMLRRVFETIAEGRSRQAQRYVDDYCRALGLDPRGQTLTKR